MANSINDESKVISEGRKKTLKNETEPLSARDRIQKGLMEKLRDPEMNAGEKIRRIWDMGNANRQERLRRQREYLLEFDEFLEPIYAAPLEWSSTLHMPVAFTIAKTFHSRMLAALLGQDPPFTVASRQAANAERAPLIQELMRYTVKDWLNNYKGLEEEADKWIWSWVTGGKGILKMRWNKEYTRYMDVETIIKQGPSRSELNEETGEVIEFPSVEAEDVEREVVIKTFDGPIVEHVHEEDLLIIGGMGDPDKADAVLHQQYLTASDLWMLSDRGVFDEEAVSAVIEHGENKQISTGSNIVKQEREERGGTTGPDLNHDLDRYQIVECYVKMDVDGSGINSDLIIWTHMETREILRATYLHRVSPRGERPFSVIHFHKREGQEDGAGIIELTYSLTKEVDAMHNMRVDFGLISTMPFGYYRPTSSMSTERIPLEPGSLVPLDNPQTDVFFPNLGNRTSFGFQEEASLMDAIQRVTGISDLTMGQLGSQGATRTATGTRAVVGESNANLDVYLRRMNRGFKKVLHYLFAMVQQNMPGGLQFRILGDDGQAFWKNVESREEIAGMFDFEVDPSSANSNKQIQIEVANQIYQITGNPLDIQLGIVTPLERFEAIKNLLQVNGVKDTSKYLKKPDGVTRSFTPEEIANRILAGIDVRLGPDQDLQGFLDYFDEIVNTDELLGQFSEQDTVRLAQKAQEAKGMLQALKEQQAQQANARQMQLNAQQSQLQAPTGLNSVAGGGGTGGATGQ